MYTRYQSNLSRQFADLFGSTSVSANALVKRPAANFLCDEILIAVLDLLGRINLRAFCRFGGGVFCQHHIAQVAKFCLTFIAIRTRSHDTYDIDGICLVMTQSRDDNLNFVTKILGE